EFSKPYVQDLARERTEAGRSAEMLAQAIERQRNALADPVARQEALQKFLEHQFSPEKVRDAWSAGDQTHNALMQEVSRTAEALRTSTDRASAFKEYQEAVNGYLDHLKANKETLVPKDLREPLGRMDAGSLKL